MSSSQIYEFDDIRVDVLEQSVVRRGDTLRMPPRVFQTLLILMQACPRMVSKAELFRVLWPDTAVDESGLAQNIHLLRKILGPSASGSDYIETIPKRGYRLVAQVRREPLAATPHSHQRQLPWRWAAVVLATVMILGVVVWRTPRRSFGRRLRNPEAVRLVDMAQQIWNNTLLATPGAELQFRQAIQIDPGYAPAYVGLATLVATTSRTSEAERLISEALRIDPYSSDAHATAGFIAMIHHWDWNRAHAEFDRAVALDPGNTTARRWYSMFFSFRGEYSSAAEQIHAALQLEPALASHLTQQCSELSYEEKFAAALESCEAALRTQPRFHGAHARMFQIYAVVGNAELTCRNLILAADPEDLYHTEVLAPRMEMRARTRGLAGVLDDRLHSYDAYTRAEACGMLRDRACALANLRDTLSNHGFFSVFIRAEPMFHFLYGDPEFNKLLNKVGLPSALAN